MVTLRLSPDCRNLKASGIIHGTTEDGQYESDGDLRLPRSLEKRSELPWNLWLLDEQCKALGEILEIRRMPLHSLMQK